MTIEENIRLGHDETITFDQVQNAAKEANAHDFISDVGMGDRLMGSLRNEY